MRAPLLAATALWLLTQPAAAQPADFDLLKQAEQQSAQDQVAAQKAAAEKAAEEAAKKAQADKAAADKAAADKAAADAAAIAAPPAEPPKPVPAAFVPLRLASGAAAGSATLTEAAGGLHAQLGLANIPPGRYRLVLLQHKGCGKPFAAPANSVQPLPVVAAGADGVIAAAFTVPHASLAAAEGPVLALYVDDPKQAGALWIACGTSTP